MGQTFKLIDMGNGEELLKEVEFKEIKLGDKLVLRDENGDLIREKGNCIFQAISDSYLNEEGKYAISYCIYDVMSIYSK